VPLQRLVGPLPFLPLPLQAPDGHMGASPCIQAEVDSLYWLSGTILVNQRLQKKEAEHMAESVYKVIELVGTSTESWEKAAQQAVDQAAKTLRDLRIAEVVEMDMQIDDGKVRAYRTKIKVSFKYDKE
jgi:flavin-binding protein dodecin